MMSVQYVPYQSHEQLLDISGWRNDEEYPVYPEGARDKSLIVSPEHVPYKFLRPNHRYLYKMSSHRYPEQFWMEVFAYRFGHLLGVEVPPAFVAYNSLNGTSGALIEWYLGHLTPPEKTVNLVEAARPVQSSDIRWWLMYLSLKLGAWIFRRSMKSLTERFAPGGDYLQRRIPHFDRKKGTQHNFETIAGLCEGFHKIGLLDSDWVEYWAKAFTFDALIGNTDRHQDNWGFIWRFRGLEQMSVRLSPVFDNGTSMGHEIHPRDLLQFEDRATLERYVMRGRHHMKWQLRDANRSQHGVLLLSFVKKFPDSRNQITEVLKFNSEGVNAILSDLCLFNSPIRLSNERARLMERLLMFRKQKLIELLAGT